MREPLPGWTDSPDWDDEMEIPCSAMTIAAMKDAPWEWRVFPFGTADDRARSGKAARIAAEDAARAMVANMAKALGGSVTWDESEVGDG